MREELGDTGVFATKGREQEQKRPGVPEIMPLICTSSIATYSINGLNLARTQIGT